MRFDGRLIAPVNRVLFMLISVTVGESSLTGTKGEKRLLVQYCIDRGMYDQRWETV